MDENAFDSSASYEAMRTAYLIRMRLIRTVLITVPVLFLVVAFALPLYGIAKRYEELLAARVDGVKAIPDIEAKIEQIDKAIKILTPQSIEQRLSSIEKAIAIGQLKPDELTTLQDVRTELLSLKSYMITDPDRMPALRKLQDDYHLLTTDLGTKVAQKDFDSEIRHLTNLLYLSLGFFSILFTVVFGSWWFMARKQTPSSSTPTAPIPPDAPNTGNGGGK
jgi:hypothetical protein